MSVWLNTTRAKGEHVFFFCCNVGEQTPQPSACHLHIIHHLALK